MMPQDGIGVIVLVIGDHAAPLYNVVSYNVYERLLGHGARRRGASAGWRSA